MFEIKFAWYGGIVIILLTFLSIVTYTSRRVEELERIQDEHTRRIDRFEKLIIDKAMENFSVTK